MSRSRSYGKGYSTYSFHVTDDHEAEAVAAVAAERPARAGLWILRRLGFTGTPPEPQA
jgi:hypothetical protein